MVFCVKYLTASKLYLLLAGPAQKRVVVIQPISNGRFTIIPQEPQRTGNVFRSFIYMNSRMKLENFLNFLNLLYFIRFWNTHTSPSLFLKCFCTGLPVKEFISIFWRTWVVVLGPFLLSPIVLCSPEDPQTLEALKCAYLILLMAVYWMTEALPLPITSMIPMVGNISID